MIFMVCEFCTYVYNSIDFDFQQNDREYKKEHWEGQRGSGERWERGQGEGGQQRHGSSRSNWEWGEGRPQNENHERPDWNSRGSRRSWEEQQHNSRKRPHTPPMDEKKWTKSKEKSPLEGDPKGISKVKRHFSAGTFCLGGADFCSILVFLLLLVRHRL